MFIVKLFGISYWLFMFANLDKAVPCGLVKSDFKNSVDGTKISFLNVNFES